MASAINVLDDVHGGAGQQCMELYREIDAEAGADGDLVEGGDDRDSAGTRKPARRSFPVSAIDFILSTREPRRCSTSSRKPRPPVPSPDVSLRSAAPSKRRSAAMKKRHIPMNIDGITAVIFCELGFEPELGRGLFILSRSVGILAHAWEQKQRGQRIMGPMPKEIPYRYTGPARRSLQRCRSGRRCGWFALTRPWIVTT